VWFDPAFRDPRELFATARPTELRRHVGERGKLDVDRIAYTTNDGAQVALQRLKPGTAGHTVFHPHRAPVIVAVFPGGLYRHGAGEGTWYETRAPHVYVVNRSHWIEALEGESFSFSVWAPGGAAELEPSFRLPEHADPHGIRTWLEERFADV
jgi:hypothetical protein